MLFTILLSTAVNADIKLSSSSNKLSSYLSQPTFSYLNLLYSILLTFILTIIYYIYYLPNSHRNAPPSVSLLYKLITKKFDFQSEGPLSVINYGYSKLGEVFRIQILHQPITILLGPNASSSFFKSTDDQLSQKEVYHFFTPVSGKGMVYDAPTNIYIQQLRFLQQGLMQNKLRIYVDKIVEEANIYFSNNNPLFKSNEGIIDLYHAISELTINTAASTLLGPEIRANVQSEFAIHYHHLSMGMTPISFFAPYAPTEAHRKRDHARREIVKLFHPIIEQRRKQNYNKDDINRPSDFLQDLLEAKYEARNKIKEGDENISKEGRYLTTDEIVGMLVSALFAGQHTSNITTTWLVLSLIDKPQLLQKVIDEQLSILESASGKLNYDVLSEMQYLEYGIMETLRLFPPLIFLMRKVKKPLSVSTSDGKNYIVPVGDVVAVSPAVSGRLEKFYGSDVNAFNPSRYENGNAEKLKKSYTWTGFGGGRHECLGRFFAMMQIKTIVSVIVRNFELELTQPFPQRDFDAMVVGPQGSPLVKYKRREKALI